MQGMEHSVVPDFTLWRYWWDGAGAWMNRWHCTNQDAVAAIICSSATMIMFLQYVRYAWQSHKSLSTVKESHFRSHLIDLRNVFLMCGVIHFIGSAVCWVLPVYYVIAALMILNTLQTEGLIRSKKMVHAIQQHVLGTEAVEQVGNALQMIAEKEKQGVRAQLDELKEVLGSFR